jgi:hypothetical protein
MDRISLLKPLKHTGLCSSRLYPEWIRQLAQSALDSKSSILAMYRQEISLIQRDVRTAVLCFRCVFSLYPKVRLRKAPTWLLD